MVALTDRLEFVIGSKAATLCDEVFGLRTVNDLLRHYPRRYDDGLAFYDDADPPAAGEHVTIVGEITDVATRPMKNRNVMLTATLGSGRRAITATFFNARVTQKTLTKGVRVMLSGEVGSFRGTPQLTHPAFLRLDTPGKVIGSKQLKGLAESRLTGDGGIDPALFDRPFLPIYPASARLQSWTLFACINQVLDVLDPVEDPLPAPFRREHDLMDEDAALRAIHLARDKQSRQRAQRRLTYDEAIGMQWALVTRRHGELWQSGPPAPPVDGGARARLLDRLPFELTAGQAQVLGEISGDLASTRPMNRMLQGEVGSGKTIVAVLAMLQLVDAGYQCALLAPTEVLAAQHDRSIRAVLGPLAAAGELGAEDGAIAVRLLTGSMTAASKRQVRQEVAAGAVDIVVGTHALLHDAVQFDRLGMVVVDEQHRFGVEQRDTLRAKAPAGLTPHLLVMTATPIPRTVALTYYGDLETSTLRELPRGRQPITTRAISVRETPQWLARAWERITEEVAAGRQAYVVASRIDEADDDASREDARLPPATTVVELFDRLRHGPLAGLRLGLMHGRLPTEEKDAVMAAFRAGELDVLVCTTVIEVGVDVPNATVMVIMDADRFGISQLHQLRGRIGRGGHPSLCILATRFGSSGKAWQRLTNVAGSLDGFRLADLDLAERHEGDVLGQHQSGRRGTLRFLSLIDHLDVILAARELCEDIHAEDPTLRHHRGMSLLAAPFDETDRIEYLDKA
ncbi:ATP-dependent DNA helicase RecG [Mycobacterium sp. MYCO198283]|uniref:ATP-dependent DNA helicase RecG n=1 Tax=Mycobacterium sp. MYCO198283 TaxID=2883505 RepID=UPI001E5A5B4D|nr:ATP-dependent DNA helicase RecG [Mycobacterium sp. MYCO198283]MCG5433709.1 ATP-dependent DNA helicase RecG [Mycobacterium sp. MYCO198283]